jgi:hypothetical protein
MASKGPVVAGTDGNDFLHRQKVASHYQQSVLNKGRLKFCISMHYLLFALMLVKLAEDLLDRMDIFILELEELYIPKPRLWEWLWSASVLFTWTGFKAIRKSDVTSMKIYVVMNLLFALCPVIYSMGYYFWDMYEFLSTHSMEDIEDKWQGYPVALIWYAFLIVAVQVHLFQLFFAVKLIKGWMIKRKKVE